MSHFAWSWRIPSQDTYVLLTTYACVDDPCPVRSRLEAHRHFQLRSDARTAVTNSAAGSCSIPISVFLSLLFISLLFFFFPFFSLFSFLSYPSHFFSFISFPFLFILFFFPFLFFSGTPLFSMRAARMIMICYQLRSSAGGLWVLSLMHCTCLQVK